MAFTAFRDMRPFPQLMFSLFIILASFFVFMIAAILGAIPFFGLEALMNLQGLSEMAAPETIILLKYLQVIQAIGLFIVPSIVLSWLYYGKFWEYLYLKKSPNLESIFIVFALMFFAAPMINLVGEWNANMVFPEWLSGVEDWMRNSEDNAEELTRAFLKVNGLSGLSFNIFMIAFLPAIGEELLFRGVIQRIFTKMTSNHHLGVWISAILFSALHMQFFGFLPRMLLGALFGYLLVWSGSMWLPIIAHFLNNAIAVIVMYMIDKDMIGQQIEEIGSSAGSYYWAAISLGLIVFLMWMIKQQNSGSQLLLEKKM